MSLARPIIRDTRSVDLDAPPGGVVFTLPATTPVWAAQDVSVYVRVAPSAGFARVTSGYTVSLTGIQATVTFVQPPRPAASDPVTTIRIRSQRTEERLNDVTRGGSISSARLESLLDRYSTLFQEQRRDIDELAAAQAVINSLAVSLPLEFAVLRAMLADPYHPPLALDDDDALALGQAIDLFAPRFTVPIASYTMTGVTKAVPAANTPFEVSSAYTAWYPVIASSDFDTATGRLLIAQAGTYRIDFCANFVVAGSFANQAMVYVNGADNNAFPLSYGENSGDQLRVSCVLPLNAGDTVSGALLCGSAAGQVRNNRAGSLTVTRLA